MNKLYYLASPYSHKDKYIEEERYQSVEAVAVQLLKQGLFVFSPIAYNHHWTKKEYNLPGNWDFWEKFDTAFIEKMDGLIVLKLEGWENSKGVFAEIEIAKKLNLPIFYLDLDLVNNLTQDNIHLFTA